MNIFSSVLFVTVVVNTVALKLPTMLEHLKVIRCLCTGFLVLAQLQMLEIPKYFKCKKCDTTVFLPHTGRYQL